MKKNIVKFFTTIFLTAVIVFSIITCKEPQPKEAPPPSLPPVVEYFEKEGITLGWNLGNSLDAPGSETAWGNPATTQELLDGVKAHGFNLVRIPITWTSFIGPAPDFKINEERMARVAEVVGYAKTAGLKAIINLHHESWLRITKTRSNNNGEVELWNEQELKEITDRFASVWKQIALQFIDEDEWLIFESMNEIHDGGWGWSATFRANPEPQINIINEWNQVFTDVVRETGGNNAIRFLMYPSYGAKELAILPDGNLGGKFFKIPEDSAGFGRQIITFHYYEPYPFAHDATTSRWGERDDRVVVGEMFERFKEHFVDKHIPVIIGEMGPRNQSSNTGRQNRLEYITHVYSTAKEYGLIPVYWDDGGNFGMMGRGGNHGLVGEPMNEHSAESFAAMINAIKP